MLKRMIACILCLVTICTWATASALTPLCMMTTFEQRTPESPQPFITEFPEQICYLTIKLCYEQYDGTVTEIVRQVPGYQITFKVTYTYGDTGRVLGGFVSEGEYPKLGKYTGDFRYHLGVSFKRLTSPTTSVTNLGDQYQLLIVGGTYEVTYNSAFYFDLNGSLVDTDKSTITRAYYYEETHDQP